MSSRPIISVVIPLYNKQHYVRRCLSSVRSQRFKDFQIVVVDDGSSDEGVHQAAGFLSDNDILLRQRNAGVSAARNNGMAAAQGDILAFLDADDEWYPAHLGNIVRLSEAFPGASIFGTGYETRRGMTVVETTVDAPQPTYVDYFAVSGITTVINASCVAIRKEVLTDVAGFPEGEPHGEDVDFFSRVCLKERLAYHPQITSIYYRDVSNSASDAHTRRPPHDVACRSLVTALQQGQVPSDIRCDVEEYVARILLGQAKYYILNGCQALAIEALGHELLRTRGRQTELAALGIAAHIPFPIIRVLHRWRTVIQKQSAAEAGCSGGNRERILFSPNRRPTVRHLG